MLLLIFQVRSRWYALEASQVVEVIPRVHLREVPNAPPFVSGLLNYRGIIIPVIDLGTFLEGKGATPYLSTRIMIIQYQVQQKSQPNTVQYLGLIAEQVTETLERSLSDIIDPTLPTQKGHYLGGMLLDDRGMIQYLGMDKLVTNLGSHALLGLLSASDTSPGQQEV
ncbi:MAG: chemotaxis protein CheW [Prochlorotrichaceae cyanobacterium]